LITSLFKLGKGRQDVGEELENGSPHFACRIYAVREGYDSNTGIQQERQRASFTDSSIGSARVGATCPPTSWRVANPNRYASLGRARMDGLVNMARQRLLYVDGISPEPVELGYHEYGITAFLKGQTYC
jgi:hypothetical protein